jgi:ketosteroid isomerase-like protein
MASTNVELVRRGFDHFIANGEPDWALLHEEIETYDHDIMDAGEYRGHAGHRRWLEEWASAWSDFSLEPTHEVIDAGADVILVYRLKATGRSSGVTVEREDAFVCRVEDGQITRLDYYNSREQALAHVGLAPEGEAVDQLD